MAIEPTNKPPEIESSITKLLGDRRATIKAGKCMGRQDDDSQCPTFGITVDSFRNYISLREYSISGLCQSCQDGVFGSGEEI